MLTSPAPLRRRHPRAILAVGREYTVEARQVDPRFRHQGRQPRDDISAGLPIWTTRGRPQGGAHGCAPSNPGARRWRASCRLGTASSADNEQRLHPGSGARIIERWNLAPKFAKVAREHHLESIDAADTLLIIVRLADLAAAKLGFDVTPMRGLSLSATEEAALLQVSDVTLAEMLVKLEDGMQALGA
jgi:hypothetical protein